MHASQQNPFMHQALPVHMFAEFKTFPIIDQYAAIGAPTPELKSDLQFSIGNEFKKLILENADFNLLFSFTKIIFNYFSRFHWFPSLYDS
jgi:hypothetical protein